MKYALVADIGGTHARFGLVPESSLSGGNVVMEKMAKFRCAHYTSLGEVIETYLDSIGRPELSRGSIAIAAPVWNDTVRMTNLNWGFSIKELGASLGLQCFEVINDASAGVLATTRLASHELQSLRDGLAHATAPRVNLVPGTGFGIGAARLLGQSWFPVQGEGGHIGLAAKDDEEYAALKVLGGKYGRVTPENVLSGPGMLNLYKALAVVRGLEAAEIEPSEMTRLALDEDDRLASDALTMYCNLLGGLAGDYALVFGAHGGVFLSGSLLQRLGSRITQSDFAQRFADKGKVSDEVSGIPVYLVKCDHPGLLGAAAWLMNQ
jgi:glucokinase